MCSTLSKYIGFLYLITKNAIAMLQNYTLKNVNSLKEIYYLIQKNKHSRLSHLNKLQRYKLPLLHFVPSSFYVQVQKGRKCTLMAYKHRLTAMLQLQCTASCHILYAMPQICNFYFLARLFHDQHPLSNRIFAMQNKRECD